MSVSIRKNMSAFSMDLRERVVSAYDSGEGTMESLAERFKVSYSWVKKILRRRRETGSMAPLRIKGRKPAIEGAKVERLHELLKQFPDITLTDLREALEVSCSLVAIHYTLKRLGYRRIKKHYVLPNRIDLQ